MNSKFINVLVFAAGAAIGSAVTWKVLKTRYEQITREEIESVKETFAEMMNGQQDQDEDTNVDDEPDGRQECVGQINWAELEDLEDEDEEEDEHYTLNEYARLVNKYSNEKGGAEDVGSKPYTISPYDFGELDGYSLFELTYYSDGILEDEDYNIVTDTDELIGLDSLNTFGEYEDDAVFVRNDKLKADFQILRDLRTYEQARSIGPNQVGDE